MGLCKERHMALRLESSGVAGVNWSWIAS